MTRRRGSSAQIVAGDGPSLFEGGWSELPAPDALAESYPGETPRSAIAVSTLTQTAKDVLEGAFVPLWVRGEVSDFKSHRNGHWYFSLRDRTSQMRCVVWARDQMGIPAAPDDGMQVTVLGRLGVYASRGDMQFTITRIEADGEGLWRKALEATRARLEADGLFAMERKRALPRHPRCIAMVTSASGAALHDVIAVLRRRAPGIELIVSHAAVQGDSAPLQLCAALDRVIRWGGAELVILGRGGGSREDLWAFNDERLVRAVAHSPIPTISAVGHEVDISLCDLVADVRAATPSAAAEAAVTSQEEIALALVGLRRRLLRAMDDRMYEPRARAASAAHDMAAAAESHLVARRQRVATLSGRLNALSPLSTLQRGYTVASDASGSTLASIAEFAPEQPFTLRLRDGTVSAIAREIHSLAGPHA